MQNISNSAISRQKNKKIVWKEVIENIDYINNKDINPTIVICSESIPKELNEKVLFIKSKVHFKDLRFEEVAYEILNEYELNNLPKDHVYFNSLTGNFNKDMFDEMYKFSIYSNSLTVIVGEIINEPVWEFIDNKFLPVSRSEEPRELRKQLVKSRLEYGVITLPKVLRLKKFLDSFVDFYLIEK